MIQLTVGVAGPFLRIYQSRYTGSYGTRSLGIIKQREHPRSAPLEQLLYRSRTVEPISIAFNNISLLSDRSTCP